MSFVICEQISDQNFFRDYLAVNIIRLLLATLEAYTARRGDRTHLGQQQFGCCFDTKRCPKTIFFIFSLVATHKFVSRQKMNGFSVCILLLILAADLSNTSYISLTRDGYQNVVVTIKDDYGFYKYVEGIDQVKVLLILSICN